MKGFLPIDYKWFLRMLSIATDLQLSNRVTGLIRAPGVQVRAINIVTEDVHAWRTRFLFKKTLGPKTRVRITAVPNVDYNATHWWAYSEGVQAVINESIGYRLPDC